jgi:hypothetical protein
MLDSEFHDLTLNFMRPGNGHHMLNCDVCDGSNRVLEIRYHAGDANHLKFRKSGKIFASVWLNDSVEVNILVKAWESWKKASDWLVLTPDGTRCDPTSPHPEFPYI